MGDTAYVGRESVLADLYHRVDDAVAGRGSLTLVAGEAGIGKTALAHEVARYATGLGSRLLWATCWDGDGAPPFDPWVQVLQDEAAGDGPISEDVRRILPTLAGRPAGVAAERLHQTRDTAAERFRLFDDVASVVGRLGRLHPLTVVLDDLQWADVPSLLLTNFVAGRLAGVPVLLLGLYRDDELRADQHRAGALAQVRTHAHLTSLTALTQNEVTRLMTLVAGAEPDGRLATNVFRRTGGNPFFVREVAQLLLSRGPASATNPYAAEIVPAEIPDAVRQVVVQRLARLPQGCVSLLTAAAVVGPQVGVDLLSRVTDQPAERVTEQLQLAVRSRVLASPLSAAGPYRFEHDLFRETLYDQASARTRAVLHQRIGHALEAPGNPASTSQSATLAQHFLAAAAGLPDVADLAEKAVGYGLAAAASAAERFAFELAVQHLTRTSEVLELAGLLSDGARLRLLLGRAEALRLSGQPAAAVEDYRAASALAEAASDADSMARAALGVHALGVTSGTSRRSAIELLEQALDLLTTEDALQALVLAALARELFLAGADDRRRAAVLSSAAVDIARRTGDYRTLAECLLAAHDTIWLPGTAARRRAVAVEMGAAAHRAGDVVFEAEARLLQASAGLELGDPVGLTDLDEFCRLGLSLNQPRFTYLVLTRRAMRAIMLGRFAVAEELMAEASALAEATGEPDAWNVAGRLWWDLCSARGVRAEAEDHLRSCRIPSLMFWFDGLLGLALLDRGERAEARRLIVPAVETPRDDFAMPYVVAAQWADLAEGAVAFGLSAACQRHYDALRPYAGTTVLVAAAVGFSGAVDHHLGVLAAALGRADAAIDHLERAAALHARLAAWPWLARTQLELAAVLVGRHRRGDDERAAELSAQVREGARELGMPGLLRRVEEISYAPDNTFEREGHVWRLCYAGKEVRIRDAKGVADLAALLRAQGREVPATSLVGRHEAGALRLGSDPVLDQQAQQEYRSRLGQLDADLEEAERHHDLARAQSLGDERAFLVRELSAAVGLGHRDRELGDDRERARKAVAARIKDALHRISADHPVLGHHLESSISTGNVCCYRPSAPVRWRC